MDDDTVLFIQFLTGLSFDDIHEQRAKWKLETRTLNPCDRLFQLGGKPWKKKTFNYNYQEFYPILNIEQTEK